MQNLSGLDTVFLRAETRTTPMNVVGTVVLDVRGRPDLGYEAVVTRLKERLPQMAPFRKRLRETPLGLDRPVWIEDDRIDARDHVKRVRARGRPGELEDLVARIAETPLDRSKPLWEVWVIEGLRSHRLALVIVVHHAAVDGVSGAGLLLHLFDVDRQPASATPSAGVPRVNPEPSDAGLVVRALGRMLPRAGSVAGACADAGSSLGRLLRARVEDAAPVRDAAKPLSGPRTSLNRPLSDERAVAYARVPFEVIGTIREAFGGTVNDVILAACTSALREYLLDRNELPDRPLVATIPVSTRSFDDPPGGNRLSAMFTELPVHIDEPTHRYWEVCRGARNAKRFHRLLGGKAVAALAELSPGPLVSTALQLYSRWGLSGLHAPIHNLVVSNVPGPPMRLTLDGAPVLAVHPHGPLMEGVGLNVTAISYAGALDVGVLACRETLRNPRDLARGIARATLALHAEAQAHLAAQRREETPLRAVG